LLIIGFSTEDITEKMRNTILPVNHIVNQLLGSNDQSAYLKRSIISELDDPKMKNYPKTKASIQSNVWETLTTNDDARLERFFKETRLDEVMIDSYHEEITRLLFSDKLSDNKAQQEAMLKVGGISYKILIGEFKNKSGTKTNCGIDFKQGAKRVIIHIPGPVAGVKRDATPLPWFQCPRGYHSIDITLKIEGIEVGGIKVVGVERPTESGDVRGHRARITAAVAEEFSKKGIDLGAGVTPGSITVTKVYSDF